jgi:hypothetical protein
MSGITQQLPALIGVVIGASTSYLVGAATERARWRREQWSRWDEKRAQAYAEYSHAVKSLYVQSMRIANSRLRSNRNEPMDYDEALAKLGTLADERTEKWEIVLLLGNPETIATARTWHRRVWEIEFFARGERTDADQYDALQEQADADRTRFYEAARHDLGISSGEIPRGGRWDAPPQTNSSDESSQAAPEVQ